MSSGSKISRRAFFRQTLAAGGATLFIYANGRYRITYANTGAVTYKLRIVHTNDHHARIEPEAGVTIRPTPTPAVTRDLEATRQGVSEYEKHALIPHEAYQALYAAGEAAKIFQGYKVHILSKGKVISDV